MAPTDLDDIVIELPDFDMADLAVSHTFTLGKTQMRVLAEPHNYNVLRGAESPLSVVRAFLHPEDWPQFDRIMSTLPVVSDDFLTKVMDAIVNKPTGRPTERSDES